MKSQIHLIRHGITEGNLKRWFYGWTDIPLEQVGVEQLEEQREAGIYPASENADFYTSGMIRTEQTFRIIYGEKEHSVIPEFKEMNFGDFEKLSHEDLKHNPVYREWMGDKTGTKSPPKGESTNQFAERIIRGFDKLMGYHRLKELSVRHKGGPAESTVVCHGGVISAIMETHFPGVMEHFFRWVPDPGHGYTLTVEDGRVTGYEKF